MIVQVIVMLTVLLFLLIMLISYIVKVSSADNKSPGGQWEGGGVAIL